MTVLTSPSQPGAYLTVAEVAAELSCSEPTVRRRIRAGELAAVKPWQSGAAADSNGAPITWGQGERLLGSSAEVQAAAWCFVPDGTPANQWPSSHADRPEQLEREKRIAAADYELRTPERPVELDASLYVRCTRPLKIGYGPSDRGIAQSSMTLEAGAIVLRTDRIVELRPDDFEDFDPAALQPKGRRRR
jgi:excisionase family DNA binding protein